MTLIPQHFNAQLASRRYQCEAVVSVQGLRRVVRVLDQATGRRQVLKGWIGTTGEWPEAVLQEAALLRRLRHPALLRPTGFVVLSDPAGIESSPFFAFAQPWVEGLSLRQLPQPLPLAELKGWLIQALSLLAWLHQHGLTRLDLKPEHFVKDGARWYLIDLDQARPDDPFSGGQVHGSLSYLAPECLLGDETGPSADLFSLGAILGELLSGQPPILIGDRRESLHAFLLQRPLPDFPDWIETSAPELANLARMLLDPNPLTRPHAALSLLQRLTDIPVSLPPPPLPEPIPGFWQQPHPLLDGTGFGLRSPLTKGGGVVLRAPERAGRSFWLQDTLERLELAGVSALLLSASAHSAPESLLESLERWLRFDRSPGAEINPPQASDGRHTLPEPSHPGASLSAHVEHWLRRFSFCLEGDGAVITRAVLIDDPGRLDDITQRVLRTLHPSLPGIGLLLILAGDGAESFVLPTNGVKSVELPPLSSAQVRTWAEALLGPGALTSAQAFQQLLAETDGFPGRLLVQLTDRARQQIRGGVPTDDGPQGASSHGLDDESLPGARGLTDSALRLAQVVALLETPCDDRLLMEVLELPSLEPERSELIADGWLQAIQLDSSGHGLTLSRPELAQSLLLHLSDADQKLLDVRIAECLEQWRTAQPAEIPAFAVVHHFLRSEPRRALPHFQHAVTERIGRLELSHAILLLDAWHGLLRPQDPQRAELLRRSGLLSLELLRLEDAESRLHQALSAPGLTLFAERETALLARCHAALGRVQMKRGQLKSARESLSQALEHANKVGQAVQPSERLSWLHWLAWLWGVTGASDGEGLKHMERLLTEADALLTQELGARIDQLILRLELGLRQEKPLEALRPLLNEALALAEQQPERSAELRALNCALLLHDRAGEHDLSQQVSLRLTRLMHEGFNLEGEMSICNNLGQYARNAGQFLEASQHFARAARLAERLGRSRFVLHYEHEQVDVLLKAERLERARLQLAETERLLAKLPEPDPAGLLAQALLEARLTLLQAMASREGLTREVCSHLDARLAALIQEAQAPDLSYLRLEAIADRMRLALSQGEAQQALKYLAPEQTSPVVPETALAWKRLHRLAAMAHLSLEGAESTIQSPGVIAEAARAGNRGPDSTPEGSGLPNASPAQSSASSALVPSNKEASLLIRQPSVQARAMVEAPDQWLERVIRILEVADGEEKLAARLAELVGEALGGRGRVYFFGDAEAVIPLAERQQDPVSHTLIQQVRLTSEPYYCPDFRYDTLLSQAQSLRDTKRPCILCQPIRAGLGPILGVVYVDELVAGTANSPSAQRVMVRVAAMAETLLETFARRRRQEHELDESTAFLGSSPGMRRVARQVQLIANSDSKELRVLLLGETGVGKNVIARAIHDRSAWRHQPFIRVNCPAISQGLFESEMFGHCKGAFTGATSDKAGYCEQAGEGTLFLDEFGDLPLEQQGKLLSMLSDGTFRRVGEQNGRELKFSARVICATNLPLETMVQEGRFRADLLNRLSTNVCRIPALRDRGPDDLRLLICQLLGELLDGGKTSQGLRPFEDHFTPTAQRSLLTHAWPGNVRELRNLLSAEPIRQRLKAGRKVDVSLIQEVREQGLKDMSLPRDASQSSVFLPLLTLKEVKAETEKWLGLYVRATVQAQGGDKNAAAGVLKCARDTIYKYWNLSEEDSTLAFLPCPELRTKGADPRHSTLLS